MLSLLALEAALEAFDGVDLAALRRKSQALGDLFIRLIDERLGPTVSRSLRRATATCAGARCRWSIHERTP